MAFRTLLAFFALQVLAVAAILGQDSVSVVGYVIDGGWDEPIPDVPVFLHTKDGARIGLHTLTDAAGFFELRVPAVEMAVLRLALYGSCYENLEHPISFSDNEPEDTLRFVVDPVRPRIPITHVYCAPTREEDRENRPIIEEILREPPLSSIINRWALEDSVWIVTDRLRSGTTVNAAGRDFPVHLPPGYMVSCTAKEVVLDAEGNQTCPRPARYYIWLDLIEAGYGDILFIGGITVYESHGRSVDPRLSFFVRCEGTDVSAHLGQQRSSTGDAAACLNREVRDHDF